MRDLDEQRIFAALSQVETPKYDLLGALRPRETVRRPRRVSRTALVAACLVAALTICAAAVGITTLWDYFFHTPIPTNVVTTVGVSQTAGDYTLAAEDVITDENGMVLLLSLARADGALIDPQARLTGNTINVDFQADRVYTTGFRNLSDPTLSEDGKTLYFCYQADSTDMSETLAGKTLSFTAQGVVQRLSRAEGTLPNTANISLAPLVGRETPDLTWVLSDTALLVSGIEAIRDANPPLELPLHAEFPAFALLGAVMTDEGLGLLMSQGAGVYRSGEFACSRVTPWGLDNSRTATRYVVSTGRGVKLGDGNYVTLYTFQDCPLTAADLTDFTLGVAYGLDRVLSDAPFQLDFTADTGTTMTLTLDEAVRVKDAVLHPGEIRLSALGMNIAFGDDITLLRTVWTDVHPTLTMKDGSQITLTDKGGSGSKDRCDMSFQAKTETGQRFFLDTDEVVSVTIGDLTLPLA